MLWIVILWWVVIDSPSTRFSVATLFAGQGCFMIVKEFIQRPVVVSYLIQEATRLPLPDLVICPFNRFNRSFLESVNCSDDFKSKTGKV